MSFCECHYIKAAPGSLFDVVVGLSDAFLAVLGLPVFVFLVARFRVCKPRRAKGDFVSGKLDTSCYVVAACEEVIV